MKALRVRENRRSLVAAVLITMIAMPASAQKTGTRIDRNSGAVGSISKLDTTSAIRATNTFAQCVARREGRTIRNALDLPFTSAEQSKALERRTDNFDSCLGDSREFDTLVLTQVLKAGGAAEWFVRTDLKAVDLSPIAGMTDEALEKSDLRPRTALEDLGLCIIRRSPERARAFLRTDPASAEETAALRTIVPDIGPCVTQGTELKLNTPNLRAVVAYALYRAASKLEAGGA